MRLAHFLIVESNSNHHTKREIQCINCQSYGHTKSFCFRRARCVKCADYPTINYPRREKSNLKSDLKCEGNHPVNYKGCIVYKSLQRNFFPILRRKVITSESQLRTEPANTQNRHVQAGRSYASVAKTGNKQSNTN